MDESLEVSTAKKRGRPRKQSDGGPQGLFRVDDTEVSTPPGSGKRKMLEACLEADSSKRPCHGKNGMP